MMLRVVRDGDGPDNTLYCRYGCSATSRPTPAVMLLSIDGHPYLPCCDEDARQFYDLRPDVIRMAPLDGYVDMYEAAKAAALVTPEQITGQAWPAPDLAEPSRAVEARIARDQVIYCYGRPCLLSGKFTPADVLVKVSGADFGGHPWTSLCNACLDSHQADGWDPEETRPVEGKVKADILRIASKSVPAAGSTGAAFPLTGALICFVIGIPACAFNPFIGLFFIALAMIWGGMGFHILSKQNGGQPHQPAPAPPQQQGYTPIPAHLNPDVVQAVAMGGAALAAHEAMKHHRQQVTARRAADRERQAANRAHSAQLQAEYYQVQDNAAAGLGYRTNEQVGYGVLAPRLGHAVPGRHTPRSDIYGNLV